MPRQMRRPCAKAGTRGCGVVCGFGSCSGSMPSPPEALFCSLGDGSLEVALITLFRCMHSYSQNPLLYHTWSQVSATVLMAEALIDGSGDLLVKKCVEIVLGGDAAAQAHSAEPQTRRRLSLG